MFSVIAIIIKYDYDDILHVIIVLIIIVYYNPFSLSSTYAYLPFFLALLSLSLLSCFLLPLFSLPALSTPFSLLPFFYPRFTFHAWLIIPFIFPFFSSSPSLLLFLHFFPSRTLASSASLPLSSFSSHSTFFLSILFFSLFFTSLLNFSSFSHSSSRFLTFLVAIVYICSQINIRINFARI